MEKRKLSSLCLLEKGKQIDTETLDDKNIFPYVNGGIKESGFYESYNTSGDTITISEGGASCGFVNYRNDKFWCGCHCYRLTNFNVNFKYLYFALKANQKNIMDLRSGVAMPNIKKSRLEDLMINIDEDAKKQDKIVKELSELTESIGKEQTAILEFNELIKSRFNELRDRERKTNTFGTFASIYSAKKCGNAKYPILSITKDNGIVFQDEKFKKRIASIDTKNYKIVPKGIFVQGIHIDEKNFDIQCIADNGIVSPAYKLWRINENICVPLVVAYAMRTDFVASYIKDKSSGSVDRRENLSNEEMKCIPLNLPSILAQKEFFKFKEQVDKLKFNAQKRIDLFQELLNKKMDEYFN